MPIFLVMDEHDIAVNAIAWDLVDPLDVSGYARLVQYDGAFNPGWKWDGANKVLVDPTPPLPEPVVPNAPRPGEVETF